MTEDKRQQLNELNKEALVLQADLADARLEFKKRFANKSLTNQEYISVTLSYWLHIFLTEEKPRSFMYEVFLKANKDEDPHVYLPDFKFEKYNLKTMKAFKIQGNFSQK